MKDRKVVDLDGGEVGRNWEEQREGNQIRDILCEKKSFFFFNKTTTNIKKKEKEVISKLGGKEWDG